MKKYISIFFAILFFITLIQPVRAEEQEDSYVKFERIVREAREKLEASFSETVDVEAERAAVTAAACERYGDCLDSGTITPLIRVPDLMNSNHSFEELYAHANYYAFYCKNSGGEYTQTVYFRRTGKEEYVYSSAGIMAAGETFEATPGSVLELLQRTDFKNAILLNDRGKYYVMVEAEDGSVSVYPSDGIIEYSRSAAPIDGQTFLDAAVYRNQTEPVVTDEMRAGLIGGSPWGEVLDYLGQKPAPTMDWTAILFIGGGCAVVLAAAGGAIWIARRRKKSR